MTSHVMPRDRAGGERGVALVWAILLTIVIAGLSVAFTLVALRAGERSDDAARRVANNATTQTAVTRVLFGYQNDWGSEQDFYTFDHADLTNIIESSGALATVRRPADLRRLPAEFSQTFGVWEHVVTRRGNHELRQIGGVQVPNAIVEEGIQADPRACTSAGLPRATCDAGRVNGYWQVVRIVMPDITGRDTPSVVVTLRSWLGDPRTGSWSRASYARVEMRPGRFADFQLIADGNMHFGSRAVIDGPVHSNGLDDGSFSTVHAAPGTRPGQSWTYLDNAVTCRGAASITMRVGRIFGPSAGGCNVLGANGQTISFMRAMDSIQTIRDVDRVRSGVHYLRGERNRPGTDPYETAWDVRFDTSVVRITRPDGVRIGAIGLDRVNAFVFDDDVRVRGTVGADRRVTVAAGRPNGASATIYINGNIRKGDDESTSIGLISQGDVVLWQTDAAPCAVTRVEAGIVAATGGVTIPTKFTSDELQSDAPRCGRDIYLDGSMAGHRPPTLIWSWTDGATGRRFHAGYTAARAYTWDEQLKRNPPPFFPLTGTWQPFNVRAANSDCFIDPARRTDPGCR